MLLFAYYYCHYLMFQFEDTQLGFKILYFLRTAMPRDMPDMPILTCIGIKLNLWHPSSTKMLTSRSRCDRAMYFDSENDLSEDDEKEEKINKVSESVEKVKRVSVV